MTIVGTQLNVMFVRVLGEVKEFRMKDRNLECAERRNKFHPVRSKPRAQKRETKARRKQPRTLEKLRGSKL
jgi:hypothetical protein